MTEGFETGTYNIKPRQFSPGRFQTRGAGETKEYGFERSPSRRRGSSSIIRDLHTLGKLNKRRSPFRIKGQPSSSYTNRLDRALLDEPSAGFRKFLPTEGKMAQAVGAENKLKYCIDRASTPWTAELCALARSGLNIPQAAVEAGSVWEGILGQYSPDNQVAIIEFLTQVTQAVQGLGPRTSDQFIEMWRAGRAKRAARLPKSMQTRM